MAERGFRVHNFRHLAVDSGGQTIDFLLTAKRDAASAERFSRKVFADPANVQLRVINVDKNPALRSLLRYGPLRYSNLAHPLVLIFCLS